MKTYVFHRTPPAAATGDAGEGPSDGPDGGGKTIIKTGENTPEHAPIEEMSVSL